MKGEGEKGGRSRWKGMWERRAEVRGKRGEDGNGEGGGEGREGERRRKEGERGRRERGRGREDREGSHNAIRRSNKIK